MYCYDIMESIVNVSYIINIGQKGIGHIVMFIINKLEKAWNSGGWS